MPDSVKTCVKKSLALSKSISEFMLSLHQLISDVTEMTVKKFENSGISLYSDAQTPDNDSDRVNSLI